MTKNPRIAFFSNRECFRKGDICYYDGANGRLIVHLQSLYPNMSLIGYEDTENKNWYSLDIQPKSFYGLPFINTFVNGLKHMWEVRRLLKKVEAEHDLLIIQLPFKSFLAPLVLRKPVVYHICSNLRTAAANPVKYQGVRLWLARTYAEFFHWSHLRYMKRSNARLISNGRELDKLYGGPKGISVVSTSIYEREVAKAEELENRDGAFRLLFVGRPSLEKGFDTLLSAYTILRKRYPNIKLSCVGFDRDVFMKTWPALAEEEGIDQIEFLGVIPFSEQLFDCYRESDLLILPSRSEGTPRVLVEARAFGCVALATRVGGIPQSIIDGKDGLLFEAGNIEQLVAQATHLIENSEAYKKLQRNGLESVRQSMTIEKFGDAFSQAINQLLANE